MWTKTINLKIPKSIWSKKIDEQILNRYLNQIQKYQADVNQENRWKTIKWYLKQIKKPSSIWSKNIDEEKTKWYLIKNYKFTKIPKSNWTKKSIIGYWVVFEPGLNQI
jgi:hypothetical protein